MRMWKLEGNNVREATSEAHTRLNYARSNRMTSEAGTNDVWNPSEPRLHAPVQKCSGRYTFHQDVVL